MEATNFDSYSKNKSIHSERWNREGAERKFLTKTAIIRRETIAVQER